MCLNQVVSFVITNDSPLCYTPEHGCITLSHSRNALQKVENIMKNWKRKWKAIFELNAALYNELEEELVKERWLRESKQSGGGSYEKFVLVWRRKVDMIFELITLDFIVALFLYLCVRFHLKSESFNIFDRLFVCLMQNWSTWNILHGLIQTSWHFIYQ